MNEPKVTVLGDLEAICVESMIKRIVREELRKEFNYRKPVNKLKRWLHDRTRSV